MPPAVLLDQAGVVVKFGRGAGDQAIPAGIVYENEFPIAHAASERIQNSIQVQKINLEQRLGHRSCDYTDMV